MLDPGSCGNTRGTYMYPGKVYRPLNRVIQKSTPPGAGGATPSDTTKNIKMKSLAAYTQTRTKCIKHSSDAERAVGQQSIAM